MITRIHVNQHVIKANRKSGDFTNPPLTIKTYRSNEKVHECAIVNSHGEPVAHIKYSPDKPLSCGATVWIETELEVIPI